MIPKLRIAPFSVQLLFRYNPADDVNPSPVLTVLASDSWSVLTQPMLAARVTASSVLRAEANVCDVPAVANHPALPTPCAFMLNVRVAQPTPRAWPESDTSGKPSVPTGSRAFTVENPNK